MLKFIVKRALPFIARSVDVDIDTVVKQSGKYLRVRVELFAFKLVDRLVKMSDSDPVDVNPGS